MQGTNTPDSAHFKWGRVKQEFHTLTWDLVLVANDGRKGNTDTPRFIVLYFISQVLLFFFFFFLTN